MTESAAAERVRRHRANLRSAGLRPLQMWVPDTRRIGFADECRRQSRLLRGDRQEAETLAGSGGRGREAGVKRGDVVTIAGAAAESNGRAPRLAVVIQSDLFDDHLSVIVLPLTTDLRETPLFRVAVEPGQGSGLGTRSQVMVDEPQAVARERIAATGGRLDDATLLTVTRALAVFLGFA